MPISRPVKLAFSTTKLLSSTDQVSKAMGLAAAKRSSRIRGLRQPSSSTPDQSSRMARRVRFFRGVDIWRVVALVGLVASVAPTVN